MLDRLAHHAYTLALCLGLLVCGLAPLHHLGTQHANITRVLPGHELELQGSVVGLAPGRRVPIYRYNPEWKKPIGHAEVVSVDVATGTARLRHDPSTWAWPVGRQAAVVAHDAEQLTLANGTDGGLEQGLVVRLFRHREQVATARIEAVTEHSATARLLGAATDDLVGTVATDFVIPNQAAWFRGGWATGAEWLVVSLVLGTWVFGLFSPVPGRAVRGLRAAADRAIRLFDHPALRLTAYVAAGIPASWVAARLGWYSATLVVHKVTGMGPLFTERGLDAITAGVFVGWMLVLWRTRRFPARVAWDALGYRVRDLSLGPLTHGQINWVLHLAIVYAFARTLHVFVVGNFANAAAAGWASAGLRFDTFPGLLHGTLWILTHAPAFASLSIAVDGLNSLLFNACIAGGLLGYGHTVLSILWSRDSIRNVDFTLAGWFTTAACYGPLLGPAVWHLAPSLHGVDPAITEGPVEGLRLVTLLWLNLLYTLSIWNMGKRFGVMVDKGLVDRGFFSVVRHPSYTLEAILFVVMECVAFVSVGQWVAGTVFLALYWVRSEREDHFMGRSNPDYAGYRDRVRRRYVPGLV